MKFGAAGAPAGWNYEWVQLVVAQSITETRGNHKREFYGSGLDKRYPAYTGVIAPDWPHMPLDPDANCNRTFTAKMWLMAQPQGIAGAIFVPLASLQWSFTLDTEGTTVKTFAQSPAGKTTTTPQIMMPPGQQLQTAPETQFPMAPETQFPQWYRLSPNPADSDNWKSLY